MSILYNDIKGYGDKNRAIRARSPVGGSTRSVLLIGLGPTGFLTFGSFLAFSQVNRHPHLVPSSSD